MAVGVYEPIRPHSAAIYTRGTILIKEAAGQTYKVGAPLIVTAGLVSEAGAAPALVKYIAAAAATGVTGGDNIAYLIGDDDLWEMSAEDALTQADIGNNYDIVKDATTGVWYVDSAGTGDQVSVVSFKQTPSLGAIGDTKARVIVKFDSANIAGI